MIPKALSDRLIQCRLPDGNFYPEAVLKRQIVFHHTAGGGGKSSIDGWAKDKMRVGTPFVIERDGKILQAFPSIYWAFALGLNTPNFRSIEAAAVQIELASYGYLKEVNKVYINAYGGLVDNKNVYTLPKIWRGFQHFEKYTDAQIESLYMLTIYLSEKFTILPKFVGDVFNINQSAIAGRDGIYTHACFRSDKTDIYPDDRIIKLFDAGNS